MWQPCESLAPQKLCTVLFGRGRLKITMKRHLACCVCQYCTSCPCAAKFGLQAGDRMRPNQVKQNFANM